MEEDAIIEPDYEEEEDFAEDQQDTVGEEGGRQRFKSEIHVPSQLQLKTYQAGGYTYVVPPKPRNVSAGQWLSCPVVKCPVPKVSASHFRRHWERRHCPDKWGRQCPRCQGKFLDLARHLKTSHVMYGAEMRRNINRARKVVVENALYYPPGNLRQSLCTFSEERSNEEKNAAKKDGLEGRKPRSPNAGSMVEPVKRKNEEKTEERSTKYQKLTHNEENYTIKSPVMNDGSNGKKAESPSARSMMAPVDRKDEEKATHNRERTPEKLVSPICSPDGPSFSTKKQEERDSEV